MDTFTKADFVNVLSDKLQMDKRKTKKNIELFFDLITLTLEKGEEIKLSGFGNFELKNKKSRPGRNPKTGIPIEISPRRVVTFNPGQKLRKLVNNEQD